MKSSSDLFHLIKSLTKSEKRYFKLAVPLHKGEKNYLKLFDSIDRQKEYDEESVRTELKNEKFIGNLSDEKNNLYNLILKSLRAYDSNKSADVELKGLLHNIKILNEKGLYKQCEKMILKAEALAGKYEKHLFLLELSEWKILLIRRQSYQGKTTGDLKKIFRNGFNNIDKYRNLYMYRFLNMQMFIKTSKEGYTRSMIDLKAYKKIVNHQLFRRENNALSFEALRYFYAGHSIYFTKENNFIDSCYYDRKLVELMEKHPHQISESPEKYFNALRNLAVSQSHLKKYDEVMLTFRKIRNISANTDNLRTRISIFINTIELDMYIGMGEFDKGIQLLAFMQGELGKIKLPKNTEILLSYTICYIYFGAGNYREARNYLNKIINDTTADVRSDIYCLARIMLLIVHYELGHEELLEYMEKSAHRYLDKKERLYKVETAILDFMRTKAPEIIATQDKIKAFKGLKSELGKITKDPFEKKALEYFDFISWLESKIENRPFAEIVREKASR